MGFAKFRVGHAGAHKHTRRATPNATCKTGGFYQAPTNKQVVDALKPLEIKWDNTCLDTKKADIYLYAPIADHSRVAVWQNVDFASGSVSVDLMPRWWNSTDSMNLQLGIVIAGQPPFLSDLPAGPVFTANYAKPANGNVPPAADTSLPSNPIINMDQKVSAEEKHGLSPGRTAAAVIFPLLIVIGCVLGYIRWQRKKVTEKSQRFSVAVDKRMSTISTDWKSVTAAGANAAIRNSMAVSGNRASSFSFGGIRPTSTFGDEPGQAGVGTRQMSQMRTGVGLRHPNGSSLSLATTGERVSRVSFADGVRQSRVSFANDPRPSTESRRTRAYHNDYIPPVPSLPANAGGTVTSPTSDDGSSAEDGALSPRQTQGPLTLTPEDIRARIVAGSRTRSASNASSAAQKKKSDEIDDVLPALSMMRTDQGEEFLLPSPPPAHTHVPASPASPPPRMMSPVMGTMPMSMPMPASVMSPDEMLRAYAERKKTAGGAPISYPMPVASSPMSPTMVPMPMSPPIAMAHLPMSPNTTGGNNVRPLFSPTGGVMSPTNTGNGQYAGHGKKGSVAVGQYGGAKYEIGDDEDPYGGTA